MDGGSGMMNGGAHGSSGGNARALTALLLCAMLFFGLVRITANVYSYLADRQVEGHNVAAATAWLYEGTSLAAWTLMMIPCWFTVGMMRAPRFRWPVVIAIHALLATPFALCHIGLMVTLRMLMWWVAGENYEFAAPDGDPIIYEFRKDIATYAELLFILFLVRWIGEHAHLRPSRNVPITLAVQDGPITHHLPVSEFEQVTAAGNYVEIIWHGQRFLHRATLTATEAVLAGAGFARIHRSRMIRKTAIRRVTTRKSGDFDIEMESGDILRGSRRYRVNIEG